MEEKMKKWDRELLVHSVLRGLIGFVLLETLMVWLTVLHPGGEPDGFSMILTGLFGILNGFAVYCCFGSDRRVITLCWVRIGAWRLTVNYARWAFIMIVVLLAMMAFAMCLFFFYHVELPIVQGCNFSLMIIYGSNRSQRLGRLNELIRSSFEH